MFKQNFITTTTASNRSIDAVVAYDGGCGIDETLNANVSHAGGVQPSLRRNKEPLAGLISWRSDTPWFAGATSQLPCGPFNPRQREENAWPNANPLWHALKTWAGSTLSTAPAQEAHPLGKDKKARLDVPSW